MQITWLGQAGLLLEHKGRSVMIDPYLSDRVEKRDPRMVRLVPADTRFFSVPIDVVVCTHDHLDHTDPDTLEQILNRPGELTVLASRNAWRTVCDLGRQQHNVIQFDVGTEVTISNIRFCAMRAVHSDSAAIGVWLCWDGMQIYVTGDTLYHPDILRALPGRPDLLFVCINGRGNNMNCVDAARFANQVGAACTVPVHWGMFACSDADPSEFQNKTLGRTYIPTIYRTACWDRQEKRMIEICSH